MIFVDEMKDLKMYTKSFYLPITEKNKKKGSAVYLLTPNLKSSMNLLKSPLLINNNGSYRSYYMEKNVNYYFMNEGYFTVDNRSEKYIHGIEENVLYEATSSSHLFFLSEDNHDGKTLTPRVPSNFLTKGGYEDSKTPRVCFSTHIDGALIGLSQNLKGKTFYVHKPENDVDYHTPTLSEVPDSKVTNEVWVTEPVKIKCVGKIEVIEADKDYKYKYGNNTATTCSWKWKWVDKPINESSNRTIYPNKDFVSVRIRNNQNKYLVIFSNYLNKFIFPYGEVMEGEEDYQAIKRIIAEKYNLTLTDYRKSFKVESLCPYRGNKQAYITNQVFSAYDYDGFIKNLDPKDIKGYKWLSFREIMELPTDLKSSTLAKFEMLVNSGGLPDDNIRPTLLEYKTHNFFYYGYKTDVSNVKKVLNERYLKFVFGDLEYSMNPHIRINVNVVDDISKYRNCTPDTMWVYSKTLYNYEFEGDYDTYLKSELYTFILNKYNSNICPELLFSYARYASGEYLEVIKNPVNDNSVSSIYKIMEYIDTKYGKKELINIVKKNDIRKFCKYGVETSVNSFNTLIDMFESSLNENRTLKAGKDYAVTMDQLSRRHKMRGRRGSQYVINQINKRIQKTVDPDEPMPEIKDADGNILNPTTAPDLQKPGATPPPDPKTGQVNTNGNGSSGLNVATSDSNGSKPDEEVPSITDESYLFDDYFEENDYLLNTDELVMISEEAVQKNNILKKLLYQDRIKRNKEVMEIYTTVKQQNEKIKFTYHNLDRYKGDNLFIDLYYYNEVFFRNSNYQKQKGLRLYSQMMSKLLAEERYTKAGYTKKTVFIPVRDWNNNPDTNMWIYREDINPVSIITEGIKNEPMLVKNIFKDMDVVFFGSDRYFKINFSHFDDPGLKKQYPLFLRLIKVLATDTKSFITPEDDDNEESKKAIVMNITDKIEKSQGVKFVSLGLTGEKKIEDKTSVEDGQPKEDTEKKKEELLTAINKAAETSKNTDDALEQLDNEKIKELIIDLASEEEGIKINQARSSRMMKLQDDFIDKQIKGRKINDLLSENRETIPTSKLNVGSINKDWESVKAINFNDAYDLDSDIIKILNNMSTWSRPIAIRDASIEDTSTSEDFIYTYTVQCEDANGTRFTLKFDIPKFIDNNYMVLRGNKKQLNIQRFLMPIIKTENYTCQIISNYNKIFVRRSTEVSGKSNPTVDRLLKTLNKYNGNKIEAITGDCSAVCNRYELPLDYIDMASVYSKIETPNYIFYFNQRELREKHEVDNSKGVPYFYDKKAKQVGYFYHGEDAYLSSYLISLLLTEDNEFREIYENTKPGKKYCYSQASMLGQKIPLIVVMAYSEGLTLAMKKAGIEFDFKEKLTNDERHSDQYGYIKFNDGYVYYKSNYSSDMLMNGLKDCNTESHSINEINKRNLYSEFLENFGGRLVGDGLDSFYDCMIDPITKETLEHYKLPTDYVSVLAHANNLMTDNKFIAHNNFTSAVRLRREELIAAKLYRVLCTSYESYSQQLKHTRVNAKMTIKQSAVIDAIMEESILSDKSFCNALSDVEDKNCVSAKGHSGMNTDRAYSLDKRGFDPSMMGILTMGTGFSGNVGINRQASIDFNVDGARGYVKTTTNLDELNTASTLSMTEAVTPFGSTHDDPIRTAMTFIQTSKHSVTTYGSDPSLVTNGADEALPYYASDIFAFKAKENGKVIEMNDRFMIVEYKSGKKDMVQLGTDIEKNSNGGYHVAFELVTDLKVGSNFKKGDIIAYENSSFTKDYGEDDNLAYNIGKLTKIAIINTEEGYEDSAAVTQDLCNKLTTRITMPKIVTLPKNTNVFNVLKKGTPVEEGDTLMIMQAPSDQDDVNLLLKNLAADEEEVTELGRIPIHSHYTGIIKDVKIYRTCDIDDEMSDSLKKLVKSYEADINKYKNILKKNGITTNTLPPTDKVEAVGRFKHCEDSVIIEFDIEYEDVFGIGDKLVYYSGNKGVNKYIIPEGQEPTSTFRPDEKLGCYVSIGSINGRMITSTILTASLNKLMIELDRTCKDMAGIKYDVNDI